MEEPQLTTKERHRLLAQLANFIEDLPTDRLDMRIIAAPDATEESCGSAGCAMGWAGTIHKRFGLRLVDRSAEFPSHAELYGRWILEYDGGVVEVFERFYGLDNSLEIVQPDEYAGGNPNPRQVAERIRDVLRRIDPDALIEVGSTTGIESTALQTEVAGIEREGVKP